MTTTLDSSWTTQPQPQSQSHAATVATVHSPQHHTAVHCKHCIVICHLAKIHFQSSSSILNPPRPPTIHTHTRTMPTPTPG